MSDEIINTENINNEEGQSSQEKIRGRSVILGIFLNFLSPGLGIFYAGKFSQGILIALLWPLLLGVFGSLCMVFSPGIMLVLLFLISIFFLIALITYTVHATKKGKNYYIVKKWNHPVFYIVFVVVYVLYAGPIVKSFIEAYKIPTGSMETTLLANDFILVKKNEYGIVLPYTNKKIIDLKSPARYEVVIFNHTDETGTTPYIKRIIGMPGDTIKVKDKAVFVNGKPEEESKNYHYDKVLRDKNIPNHRIYPEGALWNEDFYGPYYIPKKGDVINLTSENKKIWWQLIFKDAEKSGIDSPQKLMNENEYVIKNNYYFVMGDNRNNSLDSRFTGPVAEDDIYGKAGFIYFNKDKFSRIGLEVK